MQTSSNGRQVLGASMVRHWGTALKFCREKHGYNHRHVAQSLNVSIETVQEWEGASGAVPGSQKMARLYGMLPQLRHFRHLIPAGAQKKASIDEALEARARKGAPPAPAPQTDQTFGSAFAACRIGRNWSQKDTAKRVGITASALSNLERSGGAPSVTTYRSMLKVFPELRNAPQPVMKGPGGRILEPVPLPPYEEETDHGAQVPVEPEVAPARTPLVLVPAVVEPLPTPAPFETQVLEYARALEAAQAAAALHDDALLAALEAEEAKNAAFQRAASLLEALQVAAGMKKVA